MLSEKKSNLNLTFLFLFRRKRKRRENGTKTELETSNGGDLTSFGAVASEMKKGDEINRNYVTNGTAFIIT